MQLLLKPGWPGPFRRTVKSGARVETYVFTSGEAIEVCDEDLHGLAADLGKALVIPKPGTSKPDYAATEVAVAQIAAEAAIDAEPTNGPSLDAAEHEIRRLGRENGQLKERLAQQAAEHQRLQEQHDELEAQIAEAADVSVPKEPTAVGGPSPEDFLDSLTQGGIETSPAQSFVADEPIAEAPAAEDRRGNQRRRR